MAAVALLGSTPASFACDRDALLDHLRQTAKALGPAPTIPKDARSIVLQHLPLALDSYKYVAHVEPATGRAWLVRSGGLTGDVEWFGPVVLPQSQYRCAGREPAGATTGKASERSRVIVNASAFNMPAANLPVIRIDLSVPGLTAEQVEAEVAIPLERKFNDMPGVSTWKSSSMERRCSIELTFDKAAGEAEKAVTSQALAEAVEKMRVAVVIRDIAIGSPQLR